MTKGCSGGKTNAETPERRAEGGKLNLNDAQEVKREINDLSQRQIREAQRKPGPGTARKSECLVMMRVLKYIETLQRN